MSRAILPAIDPQVSVMRRPLVVGLVNNTSDRALKATENQFKRLLRRACPGAELQFKLFSCREDGRNRHLQDDTREAYADVGELFGTRLDALIVTGMEPRATRLQDEPVWGSLTKIADWAQDNAVPVSWSCLAAHAAVLYLDGIARSPMPGKLSGVFGCDIASVDHPLAAGLPSRWTTPHSRHYDVAEAPLVAAGYQIVSRSHDAGVDIFVTPGPTPFVFFQGHPEYDAGTLVLEYARDVRRYLIGERDEYPLVPRNYIDAATATALEDRRDYVLHGHRDLAQLNEVLHLLSTASLSSRWHLPAVRLYANWIACMVQGSLPSPCMKQVAARDDLRRLDLAVAGEG